MSERNPASGRRKGLTEHQLWLTRWYGGYFGRTWWLKALWRDRMAYRDQLGDRARG